MVPLGPKKGVGERQAQQWETPSDFLLVGPACLVLGTQKSKMSC